MLAGFALARPAVVVVTIVSRPPDILGDLLVDNSGATHAGRAWRPCGTFCAIRWAHGVAQAAADSVRLETQRSISVLARAVSACLRARLLAGPFRRLPSRPVLATPSICGNSLKLMFIGWKERGPSSIVTIWPPVM